MGAGLFDPDLVRVRTSDMTTYDIPVRTVQIPTWTRGTVMKVWAAAAIPMAILAWVVAPLLARTIFSGSTALPRALILALGAGLIWQFALVLIVVRREQDSLRWPVLKKALWLNAPISARTGKRSNRLWWMIIPLMVLLAAEEFLPALPTPASRDAGLFFGSDTGQSFLAGNWVWFFILVVQFVFNTALGEELFFRGLLLPRMGVRSSRLAGQRRALGVLPPPRAVGDPADDPGRHVRRGPALTTLAQLPDWDRGL